MKSGLFFPNIHVQKSCMQFQGILLSFSPEFHPKILAVGFKKWSYKHIPSFIVLHNIAFFKQIFQLFIFIIVNDQWSLVTVAKRLTHWGLKWLAFFLSNFLQKECVLLHIISSFNSKQLNQFFLIVFKYFWDASQDSPIYSQFLAGCPSCWHWNFVWS